MKSLDPRVERLPELVESDDFQAATLDQLCTYEVFVQPTVGKPFQHEGIVHAPDLEMAFILAKESLTRRFKCVSIMVADTRYVAASDITSGDVNAYDTIQDGVQAGNLTYEVFHLLRRGKQHIHAGQVEAGNTEGAFVEAKKKFGSTKVCNVWLMSIDKIRYTKSEEADLWNTLPDKKFRDAAEYKGGDKLKDFLNR